MTLAKFDAQVGGSVELDHSTHLQLVRPISPGLTCIGLCKLIIVYQCKLYVPFPSRGS